MASAFLRQVTQLLLMDLSAVHQAHVLCVYAAPPSPPLPRHVHRGKVLALELLKVLLENSGPTFRRSETFIAAIRQYLCLSLLKNNASSVPAALQLSCSILLSLLSKFRTHLKAEVGGC